MTKEQTMKTYRYKVGRCARTGRFLPLVVARRRKSSAIVQTITVRRTK